MKTISQDERGSVEHLGPGIHPGWRNALAILIILLATLALYHPVLQFEFLTYDDDTYILNDAAVQQISWENLQTIFLKPYEHAWYPLARLSAALDIFLFGREAWGHHLVNAVLHFLNAAVLFMVLTELGQSLSANSDPPSFSITTALLFSLLFVVHPQHVEAVSWVVQRKELLACLFSLLATALFLRDRAVATTVCLLLAMLSKPTAIVMPSLLLLLSFILLYRAERSSIRLSVQARKLTIAIAISMCMAALTLINHGGLLGLNEVLSPGTRTVLFADNTLHGLSNFMMLQAGSIHQPMRDYVASASWLGLLSVLVLAILLVIAGLLVFSEKLAIRIVAFGFLFYVAALVPTGGLVLFGNYAFGDRYLYLSSVGLYISLYAVASALMRRYPGATPRRIGSALLVLWIAGAFLISYKTLPRWATTWSAWKANVERHPDSVLANYSLGHYYFQRREYPLALRHLGMVVDSDSEKFRVAPRVNSALYMAEIYCSVGQVDAAIDILEKIPRLGGSLEAVNGLLASLKFSGYDTCYEKIRRWRGAKG